MQTKGRVNSIVSTNASHQRELISFVHDFTQNHLMLVIYNSERGLFFNSQ